MGSEQTKIWIKEANDKFASVSSSKATGKKVGAIDNLPSDFYVEGHRCIIVDGIGSSVLCRH